MLNANAINDAAEKIGIKTNTVIDIFEHVLGNHYDTFKDSVAMLNFINKNLENIEFLPSPLNEETYKVSDLKNFKPIEYKYPNISCFLKKYKKEYLEIKNVSSNIIERVRINLQEGECPVCVNDLNDEKGDIVIFKCCNVVVCGKCCFGVIFKEGVYACKCANCRKEINIKELVYLNNLSFKYENLLTQLEEKNVESIVLSAPVNTLQDEKTEITKLSTIIDILTSKCNGKRVKMDIKNILIGPGSMDVSAQKKILIFGSYDSSLEDLISKIKCLNFKLLFLNGSFKQLSEISDEFNSSENNCILFINSIKYCSGLNLQTATELIFTHYIAEANIESQVIGRAQRLNRQNCLQIHYVLYDNEAVRLNYKNYES